MDERAYWIWLQQAFLAGSRKPVQLKEDYRGGVREFFQGGPKLWNQRRDLTDKETAALRDFTLSQAEARLEYALKMGWQVLCPDSEKYPRLLTHIPDPPAVLYVKGELPDVDNSVSVAVVGSRKAGEDIAALTRRFGYQLAAGGARVVSGGAVGVDSAALLGALSVPGARPVSVLPVSLDSNYVTANAKLRRMIQEQGGALVSEYFSQSVPERGTFPVRNRLITGLARGVVLIQCKHRSGTMIYATRALEQNRDVFVYPGPEEDPNFSGSRELLEDGATEVSCGEDVLAAYGKEAQEEREAPQGHLFDGLYKVKREKQPEPVLADAGAALSPEARQVLAALSDTPSAMADLAERTGLPAAALLSILTQLELEGFADSLPGKRYVRRG